MKKKNDFDHGKHSDLAKTLFADMESDMEKLAVSVPQLDEHVGMMVGNTLNTVVKEQTKAMKRGVIVGAIMSLTTVLFVIALNLGIAWVLASAITSGIKTGRNECGQTYGIEYVVSGNFFCSAVKPVEKSK